MYMCICVYVCMCVCVCVYALAGRSEASRNVHFRVFRRCKARIREFESAADSDPAVGTLRVRLKN